MSNVGDNGAKKEWDALVKVYDYLYSTYPDFQKQVIEYGFSTLESNDKGELILELDNKDSDIVVDSDKVIKLLKKAGLKRFSTISSLTLDRVLEYDYDMSKGLLNILVRRVKGALHLNLHFYYFESKDVPSMSNIFMKRVSNGWSKAIDLGDYKQEFNSLITERFHKESMNWVHMLGNDLVISKVANGEIVDKVVYGRGNEFDVRVDKVLKALGEIYQYPVKEIYLLNDDLNCIRYRKNTDGEISVAVY